MKNFLIVKLSAIGDVIHALPTAYALKETYPDCHITWVVEPPAYDLVNMCPHIDEVILFEKKKFKSFRGFLREYGPLKRKIQLRNYDAVLDLQGLFKSAAIARLGKAPIKLGMCNMRELSDRISRSRVARSQLKYKETFLLSIPFYHRGGDFESLRLRDILRANSLTLYQNELKNNFLRGLPSGVIEGLNVYNIFTSTSAGYADSLDFFSLPIPFVCMATDMYSGNAKAWHSGDLATAMRSTMAIPGMFTPVRTGGMVLLDGGMLNNFPVDLAMKMGADIVIGVDISDENHEFYSLNNMMDILWRGLDLFSNDDYKLHPEKPGR